MWETWVWSLGREDALEEDMATLSSILAWRSPMDRGAWWATVHGVGNSQTWLSDYAQHDIYVYLLSPLSLHPTTLIPALSGIQEHWADPSVLQSNFPLAVCFPYDGVMCQCFAICPLSPPSPCPQVCSLHLLLYSCLTKRFIISFS